MSGAVDHYAHIGLIDPCGTAQRLQLGPGHITGLSMIKEKATRLSTIMETVLAFPAFRIPGPVMLRPVCRLDHKRRVVRGQSGPMRRQAGDRGGGRS